MSENKEGNKITVKNSILLNCKEDFRLFSKSTFSAGKTILRMGKIARQFWTEIEDAEKAVNEVYKQHGEYDEKINNYGVKPEQIRSIEPEIKGIHEEIAELSGSKFQLDDLWLKGEKKEEGCIPSILTGDLLYKLDWLIENPDQE